MPLSWVRTFLLPYVPPTPHPTPVLWESESVNHSVVFDSLDPHGL